MKRLLALALVCSCHRETGGVAPDMAMVSFEFDFAVPAGDGGECTDPNECGDCNPGCMVRRFGPGTGTPFPLMGDQPPDPNESENGVSRDGNGYLGLESHAAQGDYLWLANASDWGRGTLTKLDSKNLRESARYFTVTCNSLKTGNRNNCDGQSGCCAADSWPQWDNRKHNQPSGPYQQVNLMANDPSRTAVDIDGAVWVANRAFSGQSSVTKVAATNTDCIDRNGNGKIESSSDVNADGVIQTDCNGNGVPDDLADVQQTPCGNGKAQEFYGLDDECVLFTTNTNVPGQWGRPLALGPSKKQQVQSDAWPGTYNDGKFFRVDGVTGLVIDEGHVMGGPPYGAAIDRDGILWTGGLGNTTVSYLDTKIPNMAGVARGSAGGYGIGIDRDQNVWTAGIDTRVYRYTPDRSKGFASLGNGYWTIINTPGRNHGASGGFYGIAVDNRSPKAYFAWTNGGPWIVRIPASAIPLPNGADQTLDGSDYVAIPVAGSGGRGAGVDLQQNVWAVNMSGSVATRIKVDANGAPTVPDILSPPQGNLLCPAGDRCPYSDRLNAQPGPYTYSDFTGFGLRNFTRPSGTWSYVLKGCDDGNGATDTRWIRIDFDADLPPKTAVTVRARSGNTEWPDNSWGAWTMLADKTPADLLGQLMLTPNLASDGWLQLQFELTTQALGVTPKLKQVAIVYECAGTPG